MKWKNPPIIKIYEALGAVADDRIEVYGNVAKVFSSSRKKFYTVSCDEDKNSIMANDNGSYWQEYLGYPSIAFLLKVGVIDYVEEYGEALRGIKWKDLNTKYKNDFQKTKQYVDEIIFSSGINEQDFYSYLDKVSTKIDSLGLKFLGNKIKPPRGY